MARPHIAANLRRNVIERAFNRCEYCLLPVEWAAIPHHIDHIIPLKHGGVTLAENLAYACFECNLAKGSDIAAFDPLTGNMTRLFHPRHDNVCTKCKATSKHHTHKSRCRRFYVPTRSAKHTLIQVDGDMNFDRRISMIGRQTVAC